MQHVDGPAHVQSLAEPGWARRPRVDMQALCVMTLADRLDGVVRQRTRRRDIGSRGAVWPQKAERAIRRVDDPIAIFVDGPVKTKTEPHENAQNGRPALGPVADIVAPPPSELAAREAARSVSMLQGAPQRGRDRPGAGSDLEQSVLLVV